MAKNKAKVFIISHTVIDMKENGTKTKKMAKEHFFTLQELNMMENGLMIKYTGSE